MRFSSLPLCGFFAALPLALVASGCGAVEEAQPSAGAPPSVAQCEGVPSAPLIAIEDVLDSRSSTALGPCGDVAFEKVDGSIWLRRRDGALEQLAARGHVAGFDVTGRLLAFSRDGDAVLRTLDGSRPDLVAPAGSTGFRFAYDPAARVSIPFLCTDKGVRVAKGGELRPAIAQTSDLHCGEHSRLGTTLLATQNETLVVVDLAREATTPIAAIQYRPTGSAGANLSHGDAVHLSRDGLVALYQEIVQRGCGDTWCPETQDLRIVRTADGRVMSSLNADIPRSVLRQYPELVDRPGVLVRWPRSGGRPFSIDTRTAAASDHGTANVVAVLHDGRIVLSERANDRIEVRVARAGSAGTTPLLTVPGQTSMVAASPTGDRIFYAQRDTCVRISDAPGCHGAGQHGDLVIRGADQTLRRHGGFTHVGAPHFLSDGRALLDAIRFVGEPPAEAPMGELALEHAMFVVSPTGELMRVDGLATSLTGRMIWEISERAVVVAEHAYDGRRSTHTVKLLDPHDGSVRTITTTETFIEAVAEEATPSGVIAFTHAKHDGSGPRQYVLWHGVP